MLVPGEVRVREEVAVVERDLVAGRDVLEADVHVAASTGGHDHVPAAAQADQLAVLRGSALHGEPRAHRIARRQALDDHADRHLRCGARDARDREVLVRIHRIDGRTREDLG